MDDIAHPMATWDNSADERAPMTPGGFCIYARPVDAQRVKADGILGVTRERVGRDMMVELKRAGRRFVAGAALLIGIGSGALAQAVEQQAMTPDEIEDAWNAGTLPPPTSLWEAVVLRAYLAYKVSGSAAEAIDFYIDSLDLDHSAVGVRESQCSPTPRSYTQTWDGCGSFS